MTSPATHDKLSTLLKRHAYFGLQSSQVTLFQCSTAPPAFGGDPLRALQLGAGTLSRGAPGSGEVFAALKARLVSVCMWLALFVGLSHSGSPLGLLRGLPA